MANPASSTSLAGLAVLLLSFFTSLHAAQGAMAGLAGGGGARSRRSPPAGYVPVRAVVYRSVAIPLPAATTASADEAPGGGGGGGGGGYEPFELCMGCRCCAAAASGSSNGSSSSCLDTQCCYAIDCNIPGKPFGVCAFSPHTCGCAGNNNCTTSS